MSHSFESGGTFTVGTRAIKTKKGGAGGGGGGGGNSDDRREHSSSGGDQQRGGGRRDRPRISLKDRKPVSRHADDTEGATADNAGDDAAAAANGDVELSALAEATGSRRRHIEVRTRHSREAKHSARRRDNNSQASGFNTRGGHQKALIVLPQNQEKMAAREKLMQIHPHIAQVFRGENPPDTFAQEPFSRILQAEAPTMEYRRRNMEAKTVLQWGERKLFLYELEFLVQFAIRPNTVVVYANCAPATRMPFLAQLFPAVNFVLVDPTPLDVPEGECPNIVVRQEQFTDAIATELQAAAAAQEKTLLFIANATTDSAVGGLGGADGEDYTSGAHDFTAASMADQARWYGLIKPAKALLKFTLPWSDSTTYYLDGDIVLPIWNAPTSTETRIIPNAFHRTWSHRHFEQQLFHWNTVTRVSLHEHGVQAEGLDGCLDCASEVFVLERFLERFPELLAVAVGSQASVMPTSSAPATSLRLDTTRFKDPKWLEQQAKKRQQFLITLENSNETDGQPLTDAQMEAATQQFDQQQQAENAEMADDSAAAAAASPAAAASAFSFGASGATPAAAAVDSMDDAAPSAALTPLQQLKVSVGKFSQELSRRLTHGGTRSLASLNDKVIKKAFSKKNRAHGARH